MAKCCRCGQEIASMVNPHFVSGRPAHFSVDDCHDVLLREYRAKLLAVEDFQRAQLIIDRRELKKGQAAAIKAQQDAQRKAVAEQVARAAVTKSNAR